VLNRHVSIKWPVGEPTPYRIVGVAADVDDMNVKPQPGLTIYTLGGGARLFVRAAGDPHRLVPQITRVIREIAANQAVERPATLEDIRAEMLSPDRLNAFVFSGFAGIALLIAVVGVSGVLAFLVSARTREFGVRLAIGSSPWLLLTGVIRDGMRIAVVGVALGVTGGYALVLAAKSLFGGVQLPSIFTGDRRCRRAYRRRHCGVAHTGGACFPGGRAGGAPLGVRQVYWLHANDLGLRLDRLRGPGDGGVCSASQNGGNTN
jgi:hypothetical protein